MNMRSDHNSAVSSHDHPNVDPMNVVLSRLGSALCLPLTALKDDLGRLSGGGEGEVGERSRAQVAMMAGLCDELIGLSRSYLDYAEVVRDTSPLRLEPAVMGAILDQASRGFAAMARERGIVWSSAVAGQDAVVWTDARTVARALGHLMRNAIDFTPKGGSVRVAAHLDGLTWRVNVTDTGPGVPEALRDRAFLPFVCLGRDEEKEEGSGSGLGLAACRLLIERLGGSVSLHDADGGGTVATVVLPIDARR
jgi:signal transduction histidine kinase